MNHIRKFGIIEIRPRDLAADLTMYIKYANGVRHDAYVEFTTKCLVREKETKYEIDVSQNKWTNILKKEMESRKVIFVLKYSFYSNGFFFFRKNLFSMPLV